jgi:hypothetical protein
MPQKVPLKPAKDAPATSGADSTAAPRSASNQRVDLSELGSESPAQFRPEVEVQAPAGNVPEGDSSLAPVKHGWLGRMFPGRGRRDQQLQTLQSGYLEMLQMMRSISDHLDRKAESQYRLMETLEHLPGAVEGLKGVGEATVRQTEMLGLVQKQLVRNGEHDQEMIGSLNNFNKTLNLMDETSRTTSTTIQGLVDHSRNSELSLRELMERSERRITTLMGVMVGILVAGLIAGGFLVLGQRPSSPSATGNTPESIIGPASAAAGNASAEADVPNTLEESRADDIDAARVEEEIHSAEAEAGGEEPAEGPESTPEAGAALDVAGDFDIHVGEDAEVGAEGEEAESAADDAATEEADAATETVTGEMDDAAEAEAVSDETDAAAGEALSDVEAVEDDAQEANEPGVEAPAESGNPPAESKETTEEANDDAAVRGKQRTVHDVFKRVFSFILDNEDV